MFSGTTPNVRDEIFSKRRRYSDFNPLGLGSFLAYGAALQLADSAPLFSVTYLPKGIVPCGENGPLLSQSILLSSQ